MQLQRLARIREIGFFEDFHTRENPFEKQSIYKQLCYCKKLDLTCPTHRSSQTSKDTSVSSVTANQIEADFQQTSIKGYVHEMNKQV